jgi:hypothetical protein
MSKKEGSICYGPTIPIGRKGFDDAYAQCPKENPICYGRTIPIGKKGFDDIYMYPCEPDQETETLVVPTNESFPVGWYDAPAESSPYESETGSLREYLARRDREDRQAEYEAGLTPTGYYYQAPECYMNYRPDYNKDESEKPEPEEPEEASQSQDESAQPDATDTNDATNTTDTAAVTPLSLASITEHIESLKKKLRIFYLILFISGNFSKPRISGTSDTSLQCSDIGTYIPLISLLLLFFRKNISNANNTSTQCRVARIRRWIAINRHRIPQSHIITIINVITPHCRGPPSHRNLRLRYFRC